MRNLPAITANNPEPGLTIFAGSVTASVLTRTLAGPVVQYGVPGRTSRGRLRVAPGALTFPDDLSRVKLTREHDRNASRGHLVGLEDTGEGIRAALRVSDGPEGDAALQEATDRTRDGLSFDVIDAQIVGDTITSALVIAIGQVGIPAYDNSRIDTIAANQGVTMLTAEQIARLAALRAQATRTPEEEAELATLVALEAAATAAVPQAPAQPAAATPPAASPAAPAAPSPAAGVPVAASMPAVPAGVPTPAGGSTTQVNEPTGMRRLVRDVTTALQNRDRGQLATAITAALEDITNTAHHDSVDQLGWSGELWSGLQYEPVFSDLLSRGPLTNWEGKGWRFTSKLAIQDYAGDKADIPTDNVTTESSSYEAARMAVGVDIDRKFFDFPSEGFVESLFAQVRESWEIQLDTKVKAWMLSNAVASTRAIAVHTTNGDATVTAAPGTFSSDDAGAAITGAGIPGATTILSVTDSGTIELTANATATANITATVTNRSKKLVKAAARAAQTLVRRRVGRPSFIIVNDEDLFDLLDVAEKDLSPFLELWGIDPKNFRSSPDVPAGTVIAGAKQAATLRTLPGSPIRVEAQDITKGGIDEAFFGYWAIEEHHTSGLVTVGYTPAA